MPNARPSLPEHITQQITGITKYSFLTDAELIRELDSNTSAEVIELIKRLESKEYLVDVEEELDDVNEKVGNIKELIDSGSLEAVVDSLDGIYTSGPDDCDDIAEVAIEEIREFTDSMNEVFV